MKRLLLLLTIGVVFTLCQNPSIAADWPTTTLGTTVGQVEVPKAYLNYCTTGNEADYLKLRQLSRRADETERARSCAEVARSVAAKGDHYLAFKYYRVACDTFNHAKSCEEILRLLDNAPPDHQDEIKQVAISVCQREQPIVRRTPYKLAVDIRDGLCYTIGQKIGTGFPKNENDLKGYQLRTSLFKRACELGNPEACDDLSFACQTYQAGCSGNKCQNFRKEAQQIACSVAVADEEAKGFVRNKERADDERERVKVATWKEKAQATEEKEKAGEAAHQQRLEDTLSAIRAVGNVAATAAQARTQVAAAKQGVILPPARTGDPIQDAAAQTMQNIQAINQNMAIQEQNKKIALQQQQSNRSQTGSSAALAGTGRNIGSNNGPGSSNSNNSVDPAQLKNLCTQNVCSQQMNACKQAGAQRACYEASACVKRCFANSVPNDPHQAEWLKSAAEDDRKAAQLSSGTGYRFIPSGKPIPPTVWESPKPYNPGPNCPPGMSACVGGAR